jgi:ABC-type uncharacterized transport system substrate-binding protein
LTQADIIQQRTIRYCCVPICYSVSRTGVVLSLAEDGSVRRRDFIKIIAGSAVAWPLAAHTQQRPPKIPRIGIIDDAPIWDHFRRGLQEAGYIEGRDITIEYRSSGGEPGQLAAVAADLANLSVDVIVTYGSAPTRAAQQATTTTPIVMIAVGDPIKAGFAQNLARRGRNITGNTILGTEMAAKRVQLLKQLIPSVSRVAFLWNPNNASHLAYLKSGELQGQFWVSNQSSSK